MTELTERINAVKQSTVTALDALLPRDRQGRGWICPRCKNGTGENGDGLRLWRGTKAKCFRCGWGGDILDVAGEVLGLTNIFQKLEAVEALTGAGSITPSPQKRRSPPKKLKDFTADFEKWHGQVHDTDYFLRRGLSAELIDRFDLGFEPHFNAGGPWWQAVIFPNGPNAYTARNINATNHRNRYQQRGRSAPVYHAEAMYSDTPCFICEGPIDTLSVLEAGGNAAGILSAADWGILLSQVDEKKPTVPLLLALDNDATGQAATVELMEALAARGIPHRAVDLCRPGRDINDELKADRARLADMIQREESY